MIERYRLVALDKVSTNNIREEIAAGRHYRHFWQAPVQRKYLVRCTVDHHGKHYRVVAKSGRSSMGYVWLPVHTYNRVFIS